jgi:hypothetical protein
MHFPHVEVAGVDDAVRVAVGGELWMIDPAEVNRTLKSRKKPN